jgi:hypothetical protein
LAFILVSNYVNAEFSQKKFSAKQNRKITNQYITENSSNLNIIAPVNFIFNEISRYHRIQGEVTYIEMQKSNPGIYGEGFLKATRSFDISYIILSPYYSDILGLNDISNYAEKNGYRIIENEELLILRSSNDK